MRIFKILIQISMNANIEKTQFFYEMKNDLKVYLRLHKMTFLFKNSLFFYIFFSDKKFHIFKYDIRGH